MRFFIFSIMVLLSILALPVKAEEPLAVQKEETRSVSEGASSPQEEEPRKPRAAMIKPVETPLSPEEKALELRRQKIEEIRNQVKDEDFTDAVTLRALNKVTARTSLLKVKMGTPAEFGKLTVTLENCWKAPPEETPESKALLRITERIPGEQDKEIFNGWMFASAPAVSALEHPVYDITVLECINTRSAPAAKK